MKPSTTDTLRLARVLFHCLGILLGLTPGCGAGAVEQGSYSPPSLQGFLLRDAYDADGDSDGRKETHIQRYRSIKGDSIFSMTTNGRVWAWSYDTHGDNDTDITKNYVIRDSRCSGVFDERYALSEKFNVPACLKATQGTRR